MENLVSLQHLTSCYKNKKVFISGHTGFKGSWLTACLHLMQAQIKGYSLAPEYKNGLFELLQPFHTCETIIADIRNKEKLAQEIISFQPDFIFHLAAQPLVRRSYKIPAETFEVNVAGTANLLEAVKSLSNKCTIIVITTDKVYENKEQDILYSEEDILGGYDPYSASKACAEIVVSSFRNSFFNIADYQSHQKAIASVRAGNVIGGGDWSDDRIIPDIIRALQRKENIKVRNPNAVRPWQHVLEPIGAYLLLAASLSSNSLSYSKSYNIGPLPGDHLTVQQLVEIAIEKWGEGKWLDESDTIQPHEAGLLKLNIEKARKELNWQPKLNSTEAVEWTINWYKHHKKDQAVYAFQQIKEYFSL
jgi:CDP-glucose 4,6-dehydratase